MKFSERLTAWIRGHFWLVLAYVLVLQAIAMLALLSDSGTPMLLYQGF